MNNIPKVGGLCAILFGAIIFASFVMITLSVASMPAEAMEASNAEARLAFAGSLPESQRVMLTVGFGLEVMVALLIVPLLLALYVRLKNGGESNVLIATLLGAISIPFFIIEQLPRFSWLDLSTRYVGAGTSERAGLVAIYAHVESLGLVAESIFWLFFGVALALYALAMLRAAFPRWLAIFGLIIASLALIGAIGSVALTELSFLEFAALILLSVWCIVIGIRFYRQVPEAGLRASMAEAT